MSIVIDEPEPKKEEAFILELRRADGVVLRRATIPPSTKVIAAFVTFAGDTLYDSSLSWDE